MNKNIITITDGYKLSHYLQYPKNTQTVYSYLEPRSGGQFKEIMFVGLQYFIKEYLEGSVVTKEKIDKGERIALASGMPFNRNGWEHILNVHDGKLPIRIKALPEGSVISEGNILVSVENTDPECFWLVNYIESLLLQVWHPITVGTYSREIKKLLKASFEKTVENFTDDNQINYHLNDFSLRGCSSVETAAIGGMAHLVNFSGSDNIPAIELVEDFYKEELKYFTICASEHSTITSHGKENEVKACENMLNQYPNGLVACVSDSYNIYNCVKNIWGGVLKEKVMTRDGTLVMRPDSGNPVVLLPELLQLAWEAFGGTVNSKGYKVLDSHVRFIQGDSVSLKTIPDMISAIENAGFSIENVVFGSGGALVQSHNRDTCKFAFKCCAINIDGEWHDVYKEPIHDAFKKSKKGRLGLFYNNETNVYETKSIDTEKDVRNNILETVFENGNVLIEHTFADIRDRAKL